MGFLTTLYDTWFKIYNSDYYLLFYHLEENGEYRNFALIFIFIPLIVMTLFYLVYKNPYAKWWYWLIAVIISAVLVWFATRQVAYIAIFESSNTELNDALADFDSGYESYAIPLPFLYANYNTSVSIIFGFFWSIILRPFSKIQKHLPF